MTSEHKPTAPRRSYRSNHAEHRENILKKCGPEVVHALNQSVGFFEDYHRAKGALHNLCYTPTYEQGNKRFTAGSSDPDIKAMLARMVIALAKIDALIVPTDEESVQQGVDHYNLDMKNIELHKAQGKGPIPRFPPPRLTQPMTEARILQRAIKAAEGILDPAQMVVERRSGSLKKLRCLVVQFSTVGVLKVVVAIEFEGMQVWSSAVGLCHPEKLPAPLLTFMTISPASDFAWPAEMPTETRISCYLRVLAIFAAQIG